MDTQLIARVLLRRRTLRRRERWTQAQVRDHQQRELTTLRAFANTRSPFYRGSTTAWTGRRSTSCRC